MNNSAPKHTPNHHPEGMSDARRSNIRAILNNTEEEAPITQPSEGQRKKETLKNLIGKKVTYHGQMIPGKPGQIEIYEGEKGGLNLHLTFIAENGAILRGYIHTDEHGANATISKSDAALNNYFRYRYPNQIEKLANELIEQLKSSE